MSEKRRLVLSSVVRVVLVALGALGPLGVAPAAAQDPDRTTELGNVPREDRKTVDPEGRCDALTLLFYPDTKCEKAAESETASGIQDPSREDLIAAAAYAWQLPLWEAAEAVLNGEELGIGSPWKPQWQFYPAAEGATLATVTIPLDRSLSDGERVVAMLRRDDSEEALVLGNEDFPFATRKTAAGVLAQASRSIPPGRYVGVAGLATDAGEFTAHFTENAVIPRIGSDQLRVSNVVIAESLEQLDTNVPPGPFRVGGFEVVPRASSTVRHGESLRIFYVVLGAAKAESGQPDVDVTYQLYAKNPGDLAAGWQKVARPVQAEHQTALVRAWELPIVAQYPETDYKLEIQVKDNHSGTSASQSVQFAVAKP
ncbi:MAG: hypothetical protein JSV80_04770 [Acidobacteriota bacterium]|nr:MAG: hypothetical protein JSV80_04770 [Acidobacteriota bacterium]